MQKYFNGISDLIDYVQKTPVDSSWTEEGEGRNSHDDSKNSWRGTKTFGQACDLALNGWKEGANQIISELNLIKSHGRSKINIHDVAGAFPVVARAIAGIPDCMIRQQSAIGKRKPIISLLVNVGNLANVEPYAMVNRAIAIASVVDQLESVGYTIEINTLWFNTGCDIPDRELDCRVSIKQAGQPMDIANIAFAVGHPSFLRRLLFGYMETLGTRRGIQYMGFGQSTNPNVKNHGEDIYFPSENINRKCSTVKSAIEYIKGIIKLERPDLFDNDDSCVVAA